jgi:hypothetical protein
MLVLWSHFKGHYYFVNFSSFRFVLAMFRFFNRIPTKSRLGFYFKRGQVNIHPYYLSIRGFLGMVFKHIWDLFNLKDLASGFCQSLMMCSYVLARCIFMNKIVAFGVIWILVLTKPFGGIWPISLDKVFYQLMNRTFYLSFHDAFVFQLSLTNLGLHSWKVVK